MAVPCDDSDGAVAALNFFVDSHAKRFSSPLHVRPSPAALPACVNSCSPSPDPRRSLVDSPVSLLTSPRARTMPGSTPTPRR
eukprot:748802-Hanusia_phi.AAC.2